MLYHLGVDKGDLPPRVLLPGSRIRVRRIMELIDGKVLSDGRQLVVVGNYEGKEVAAVDTGMGPSSASIIIREVIEAIGGKGILIRPGTSGSLQPYVKTGDLVISTGVVADDEVSKMIVGPNFPLCPSREVVDALMRSSLRLGYSLGDNLHLGITHTKSSLYEFEVPKLAANPSTMIERLQTLKSLGVLATEMECSVLLALSSRYNLQGGNILAGCILLVVSGYLEEHDEIPFEKVDDINLVEASLFAITSLDI